MNYLVTMRHKDALALINTLTEVTRPKTQYVRFICKAVSAEERAVKKVKMNFTLSAKQKV